MVVPLKTKKHNQHMTPTIPLLGIYPEKIIILLLTGFLKEKLTLDCVFSLLYTCRCSLYPSDCFFLRLYVCRIHIHKSGVGEILCIYQIPIIIHS